MILRKTSPYLLAFAAVLLGVVVGWLLRPTLDGNAASVKSDTVVLHRIDTVRIDRIVKIHHTLTRTDTVMLVTADTVRDTVLVVVPITSTTYSDDSTYRAVVSGYRATLDSLTIYPRSTASIITQATTKIRQPLFSVSAGVQAGYGITPKGMQPYVGVGVSVGITLNRSRK